MHAPVGYEIDPECQNVVSGPVTMITLEGAAAAAAAAANNSLGGLGGGGGPVDRLQEEIARLRLDKLELLRQNVSARHEVRRLRERETQLQADLASASREIHRLREGLRGGSVSAVVLAGGGGDRRLLQNDIKR